MASVDRFIIFAQPRSGSTSLVRSLCLHPELDVAEEPFHHNYGQWHPEEETYVDSITDIRSLEDALERVFARYHGMKVLDYQLPKGIYSHMLLLPSYAVILLRRRNVLRGAVSNLIAEQTGVWHISDLNPTTRALYNSLQPLSMDEIAEKMRYMSEYHEYYRRIIAQKPEGRRLLLDYEDLYTMDLEENRTRLRRVFTFLGLDFPEGQDVDFYLDPKASRINVQSTYLKLPNGEAINERFGSDMTGWLFEENAEA